MRVGFRFKGLFFDSPAVIKAVDDATYRTLVRFGQYVGKVARHSIKTRPGPSAPGEPPHNQTSVLKGFILYGFDPPWQSVVIGAAKCSAHRRQMPAVHERRTPWLGLPPNGIPVVGALVQGHSFPIGKRQPGA